jgi:hypothetical protein
MTIWVLNNSHGFFFYCHLIFSQVNWAITEGTSTVTALHEARYPTPNPTGSGPGTPSSTGPSGVGAAAVSLGTATGSAATPPTAGASVGGRRPQVDEQQLVGQKYAIFKFFNLIISNFEFSRSSLFSGSQGHFDV